MTDATTGPRANRRTRNYFVAPITTGVDLPTRCHRGVPMRKTACPFEYGARLSTRIYRLVTTGEYLHSLSVHGRRSSASGNGIPIRKRIGEDANAQGDIAMTRVYQ